MTAWLLGLGVVYVLAVLTAWAAADVVCRRRCRPSAHTGPAPLLRAGDTSRLAGRPTRHRKPDAPPPG